MSLKKKKIDFQDFILEHYSEDGSEYENEIADLMDLRQVSWVSLWNIVYAISINADKYLLLSVF